MIKKGYTMMSMLVCLFILSAMTLLTLGKYTTVNKDDLFLYSDFIYYKASALAYNEPLFLKSDYLPVGHYVQFTHDGGVENSSTIDLNGKKLVITFRSGYAHF